MAEKKLVDDLARLKPKLTADEPNVAEARQAAVILGRLSKSLHEKATVRRELGAGPLPQLLADLLDAGPGTEDAEANAVYFALLGEVVLAADGLIEGNNEANAKRLYQAFFPQGCMVYLLNAQNLSQEAWRANLVGPWAPIVSILAKITLFEIPERDQLCIPETIRMIPEAVAKAYTPGEWEKGEAYAKRANLVEYMLQICESISEAPKITLELGTLKTLLPSFVWWTTSSVSKVPADIASFTQSDLQLCIGKELAVLYHSATILWNFTQIGKIDVPGILGDEPTLRALLGFVENNGCPSGMDQSKLNPQSRMGVQSALDHTRDVVTNIVLLCVSNPANPVPQWFWEKMAAWLEVPRMRSIALLALGNGMRDREKAHALLLPPSELPQKLVSMLRSVPPGDIMAQQALVSFIRNLTVNPDSRPLLGAPIVEGILALKPLQPARDRHDRLQRDAMIAVSNLASAPEIATRLMSDKTTVDDFMALVERSDQGLVKSTAVSSLALMISGLPSSADDAWVNATTTPILMAIGTLAVAAAEPTEAFLLDTCLKALLHVAKHSSDTTKRIAVMFKMNLKGKTLLRLVSAILVPPPIGAPPSTEAIEATALALVKALDNPGITNAVKDAAAENKKAGRKVVEGVDGL